MYHRKIFVGDGLVALVTSYYKGYTCTGTTKIIHRYLPREVGELYIHYRCIILPFVQKTKLLQQPRLPREPPVFLWPECDNVWTAQRLPNILKRETAPGFWRADDYLHSSSCRNRNLSSTSRDWWIQAGLQCRGKGLWPPNYTYILDGG